MIFPSLNGKMGYLQRYEFGGFSSKNENGSLSRCHTFGEIVSKKTLGALGVYSEDLSVIFNHLGAGIVPFCVVKNGHRGAFVGAFLDVSCF